MSLIYLSNLQQAMAAIKNSPMQGRYKKCSAIILGKIKLDWGNRVTINHKQAK
ncbi:MAG: hypothetical protein JSW18_05525 [Candidatus Omnitrophota bacterium]|nr:MAG: hypothetical protein JSW18_05525 [Candidatus Omnitrophota bacterium]